MAIHIDYNLGDCGYEDHVDLHHDQTATFTEHNHAHCTGTAVIKGKTYNYSCHMYHLVDNGWGPQSTFDDSPIAQDVYLRGISEKVTNNTANKASRIIPRMLTLALEAQENSQLLISARNQAEINKIGHRLQMAKQEREELVEKIACVDATISELATRLNAARHGNAMVGLV